MAAPLPTESDSESIAEEIPSTKEEVIAKDEPTDVAMQDEEKEEEDEGDDEDEDQDEDAEVSVSPQC